LWDLKLYDLDNLLLDVARKKLNLAQIINDQKTKLLDTGKQKADSLRGSGISFVCNRFEKFPQALNQIGNPPRWLFIQGNLDILSSGSIVAIIGTRDASQEGKVTAYHLAKEFVFQNIVVLSGLAEGIDKQAHQGAVDYYGQTIGILGHGFDAVYATKDKQLWENIVARDGAIITEYLPKEAPSRENFLRRNELQAALSKLVIPVEAPDLASGTGATIRRALNLKTQLLGVDLDQRENAYIKKTVENLRSLGIPIFRLPGEFEQFWTFIRSLLPEHEWNVGARPRQQRFLKVLFGHLPVLYNFSDELRRASFTEKDVDWLAKEIKKKLG
jgi:DNA protecting protein DprA